MGWFREDRPVVSGETGAVNKDDSARAKPDGDGIYGRNGVTPAEDKIRMSHLNNSYKMLQYLKVSLCILLISISSLFF
jgi:hypothetical protein